MAHAYNSLEYIGGNEEQSHAPIAFHANKLARNGLNSADNFSNTLQLFYGLRIIGLTGNGFSNADAVTNQESFILILRQ